MGSGAAIATAFVELRVDSDQAKTDARKVIDGIAKQQATMKVDADTTDALAAVGKVTKTIDGESAEISVDATTDEARAKAKKIIGEISNEQAELQVVAEDRASSTLQHIQANLDGLDGDQARVYLEVEKKNAEANLKDIEQELKQFPSETRTQVLLANKAKFEADVRNINGELDKIPEKGKSVGQELTHNLTQYFSAAIFVGQIRDAIGAASELEQQVGGTEAVFRDAAGPINDFAKTAADSVGLAESAFRQYSTSIGGQLKGAGLAMDDVVTKTLGLIQIAGDLSATYGGTTKEAVEALGSAFRGEFDSAERFNLQLSAAKVEAEAARQGFVDAEGAATPYGKAIATIALIQDQSKDAAGQFAAQINTTGEQAQIASAKFENAKASLGANLLPVVSQAAQLVGTLAEGFGALPGPVQTAIVAMGGVAILVGPIRNVISSFQGLTSAIKGAAGTALLSNPAFLAIATLATIVAKLGIESGKTSLDIDGLSDSLRAGTSPIKAVNDNLAALVASHAGIGAVFERVGTNTLEVAQAFTQGGQAAEDMGDKLLDAAKGSGITLDDFNALLELISDYPDKFQAAAKDAETFRAVTKDTGDTASDATGAIEGLSTAFGDFAPNADASKDAVDGVSTVFGDFNPKVQEAAGIVDTLGGAFGDAAPPADAARRAAEDYGTSLANVQAVAKETNTALAETKSVEEEAAAAADAFSSALDNLFGSATDVQGAADQTQQNVQDLNVQILEATKGTEGFSLSLDNSTDAGRKNREQVRKNVQGIEDYTKKLAESGVSAEEVDGTYQNLRGELVRQLTQFGLTEDQASDYISTLGLTPDSVATSIELQNQETAKAQVTDYLNNHLALIPPDKQTLIHAAIAQGDYIEAKRLLDTLTAPATKTIFTNVVTSGGSGNQGRNVPQALGGVWTPQTARGKTFTLAESATEVVLPVTNLPRMKQLLADPRVGPQVAAALGGTYNGPTTVAAGSSFTVGTIVAADPRAAIAEMQRAQWAAERADQLGQVYR